MSKISTAYDEIITKTKLLFPNKTRIYNPYELSDNPEIQLKDSFGVKTLTGERVEQDFCNISLQRTFSVVFVRSLATLSRPEDFDVVTKAMLEDQKSLIDLIYSSSFLTVANLHDAFLPSIGGIEFVQDTEKKFIFCEIQFTITINELIA